MWPKTDINSGFNVSQEVGVNASNNDNVKLPGACGVSFYKS